MSRIHLIVILLSIFLPANSQEKKSTELEKALHSKNYNSFKNYFNKLASRKYPDIFRKNSFIRDLAGNYKECTFTAEFILDSEPSYKKASLHHFSVNLVVDGNQIIYFKFEESIRKLDSVSEEWREFTTQSDSLYSKTAMENLNKTFRQLYGGDLNFSELFSTVTYGNGCGFEGSISDERKLVNELVKKNDKKALMKFLQSTIAEKQIYGLDGFYQLKQKGITITAEEQRILNNIKKKSGQVSVCDGDDYALEEITEVVKQFSF